MITTVVLSFNRPETLPTAITSCEDAHEVIVMDDGSDFDVVKAVRSVRPHNSSIFIGRHRTPYEHFTHLNFGNMLAAACDLVTTPYIAYLCDDDQVEPGWLKAASDLLREHKVVVGDVRTSSGRSFPSLDEGYFCLGNFAHRKEILTKVVDPIEWDLTGSTCSPENEFRKAIVAAHIPIHREHIPALYSVQHERNLSAHVDISTDKGRFWPSALKYYEEA